MPEHSHTTQRSWAGLKHDTGKLQVNYISIKLRKEKKMAHEPSNKRPHGTLIIKS